MRILMLGNSFTLANDMPAMLAEQLNPKTKTGAKTIAALENEFWDYVVLQEIRKPTPDTSGRR